MKITQKSLLTFCLVVLGFIALVHCAEDPAVKTPAAESSPGAEAAITAGSIGAQAGLSHQAKKHHLKDKLKVLGHKLKPEMKMAEKIALRKG